MLNSPTTDSRWIQKFAAGADAPMQLVCFPHAGGSATYFFPFAGALGPDIAVRAVQYPGRQDRRREPLPGSVAELADQIFQVFAGTEPALGDVPFAFFGHSMGAVVAFEVARRLARAARPGPVWLFASGRRAPSRHRSTSVHRLSDADLVAELVRVGGTDPRVLSEPDLLSSIVPVVRADYRAIENYDFVPAKPLDCPITAVMGHDDPQTTAEEAGSWAEHTTGPFELRVLSGGHFYLDTRRDAVTALIAESLGRVADDKLSVQGAS